MLSNPAIRIAAFGAIIAGALTAGTTPQASATPCTDSASTETTLRFMAEPGEKSGIVGGDCATLNLQPGQTTSRS